MKIVNILVALMFICGMASADVRSKAIEYVKLTKDVTGNLTTNESKILSSEVDKVIQVTEQEIKNMRTVTPVTEEEMEKRFQDLIDEVNMRNVKTPE